MAFTGGVVFLPGRVVAPANYFKIWPGFSVQPIQNDDLLKPIYYHMREVVYSGHQNLREYFIKSTTTPFIIPINRQARRVVFRDEKAAEKTLQIFSKGFMGAITACKSAMSNTWSVISMGFN
jgi:hypothetical protein